MTVLCSTVPLLVLALSLCLVGAQAGETQDNFLVSDWKLLYAFSDSAIAEQTVFIYEDNTFEVMDEDESKKGTWTFDGKLLELTADAETLSLIWNEAEHRFSGEYNGMNVTMYMSIEPENEETSAEETAEAPMTATVVGGWTIAEDPAITDEINNIFSRALDNYQTGTITVAYTPYAYLGSQVVAGTNHAVLCRASEINKGTSWAIVYIYEDLQGNATVMNIADFNFGGLCTYGVE